MASLQLSSMCQARMVHKYCLSLRFSHKQQRPWICNVYRSATCKYSKTSGPVRFVPKLPKQPPTQKQDGHTNNGLYDHHHIEGTNKHVPSKALQVCEDPSLANLGCELFKQKGETHARGGFFLEQENDMCSVSVNTQHVYASRRNDVRDYAYESRRNNARDLQGSFVNSAEIYTKMQHMPRAAVEFSEESLHQVGSQLDTSNHFGKYKDQACARSGLVYEEEHTVTTVIETSHAAECKDNSTTDSEGSSADLSTNVPQAGDNDARRIAGSINLSKNRLHTIEEKVQMRENNLFSLEEFNLEKETFSQAVRTNPSLPVQSKRFKDREADLRGRNVLPCQDVESFLLKIMKAKQRALEPPEKSDVITAMERNLCVDDNNDEYDDNHEGNRLFLGQETVDENEDVIAVDSKCVVSHSTAAQEHAKNQAIRYLAMRPYTAFQLRKKLENQGIMPELADYAISIVENCGLQSDLAYAETFSRARFNHGSWGPQRIKLGLKQRGVSDEIIQLAIASVFSEEKNDSEQYGAPKNCSTSSSLVLSKVAMDHLLTQATKQWNRGRDATHETKVRRMISWLQYRGFNFSVVKTVLNHLQKKTRIEDEY